MDEVEARNGRRRFTDKVTGVLVAESIAVGISLASPLMPSKTDSTWSPAELFTTHPNYLQDVLTSFFVLNVILVLLGIVAWVVGRVGRPD